MGLADKMRTLAHSEEAQAEIRRQREVYQRGVETQFKKTMKDIEAAASKGHTQVQVKINTYEEEVVQRLKEEGFKVKDTMVLYRYNINW